MTTVPPKYQYAAIYEANEKYDDTDEVATAVTAVDDEDDIYYPVKPIHTTSVTKRRKASRSCCCICGCITLSVFICFLMLIVVIGIVYYAMIGKGVRMVTVETPIDFPIVSVSDMELEEFSSEIETFIKSIVNDDDGTTPTEDLIISSRIVNGAISQSDYLRGHAQVIMKENEFIFQTSLPMDMFPGGKHRFFVSTMDTTTTTGPAITTTSFDLGKKMKEDYDGPLLVTELLSYLATTTDTDPEWVINVLSMNVLGQEIISPEMLDENVNILQALKEDPNVQNDPNTKYLFKFINGIDSIRIEPDQIIIRARNNSIDDTDENIEHDDTVDNIEYDEKVVDKDGPKRFLLRHIK